MASTPILRFPEFHIPYNVVRLSQVSELKGRIGYRGYTKEDIVPKGSGALAISPSNISENGVLILNRNNTYVSWDKYEESPEIMVENGHILFVKTGSTYGKVSLVAKLTEKATVNPQIVVIKPKGINSVYLSNLLSTESFQRFISQIVVGGAIPTISQEAILNLKIRIPEVNEQQKIADFLSAVDKKIELLTRKKELLEQYKKGVMQKLFSREIGFKDEQGREFPEWERVRLGEIGETYNGLTGKSSNDFGEGLPYISYKQIFDNSRIDIDKFELVTVSPDEKQSTAKFGDVFFTTSSETPSEVGFSSVLLDHVNELYLNSFCFGYRIYDHEKFKPEFARFLFRSDKFRRKVFPLGQGSTRYNLSKRELMKLEIDLPDINEQRKISDFLTSLEDKISLIKLSIEITKEFKKGLLQQMFV